VHNRRLVRINALGTEWAAEDLACPATAHIDGLVVPKATPAALEALDPDGPPVIALIKTAAGVRLAHETAGPPRVAALMLGGADLAAEASLEPRTDGYELLLARSTLVMASAEAGIRAPFDVVHPDVTDHHGQHTEAVLARSLGFAGKACIHPTQLDDVHRVFMPTEQELEHAREIVTAYQDAQARGDAVTLIDGELVDAPIVQRARSTLARAPQ
jgi:citrate lyase subunit beta/citryl-CoA lyase